MPTVKFYLNPYYLTDNFCPEAVQLAQGFKELGYRVIGNCDYWERDDEFLIQKNNSRFDIAIFDHRYVYHTKPWVIQDVVDIEMLKGKPKILLERQCGQELSPQWNRDGWLSFFDLICATDRTHNHPENKKIIPWQIGLIQESKEAINKSSAVPKDEIILYNFRVPHDVRKIAIHSLKPFESNGKLKLAQHIDAFPNHPKESIEHLLHKSTGGRFNPAYFTRINSSRAFLTLGGYFTPKPIDYFSKDAYGSINAPMKGRLFRKLNMMSEVFFGLQKSSHRFAVLQWDSFRFWEGMYADCVPICLNFEYWNLALPENPIDGTHYIGLKNLDPQEAIKSLGQFDKHDLEWIGKQGKEWIEQHYSPRAQALRMLDELALRCPSLF
jgi:hypothetical protein